MKSEKNPPDAEQERAIKSSLSNILASDLFRQSERQSRFLEHIVDNTLAGQHKNLNQFSIGIDVFDRDAGFDPTIDSIVRVEAGRLRSKLREYYAGEGKDAAVVIDMPKGKYAVDFSIREKSSQDVQEETQSKKAKPVIAVLPFVNSSEDTDQEYFADGISEDIITDLSRFPGLSVIARHSSFSFKGRDIELQEIVRQLAADYILEGSVRKAGNKVRISAQLFNADNNQQLWAERYDHDLDDIFAVQDDVRKQIITALKNQLQQTMSTRVEPYSTRNLEAYDCVLRGAEYARQSNREALIQAQALFRKAITLDPEYAEAYARLARLFVYQWIIGESGNSENLLDKALDLATQAINLCPDSAFVHATLGWVYEWFDETDKAIELWQRAIELDANQTEAMNWLALNLAWSGHTREAREKINQALKLNPLENYHFTRGVIAYMEGKHESAIEHFESLLRDDGTFVPAFLYLGSSYLMTGDKEKGKEQAAKILQINPDYTLPKQGKRTIRDQTIGEQFRENLLSLGLVMAN